MKPDFKQVADDSSDELKKLMIEGMEALDQAWEQLREEVTDSDTSCIMRLGFTIAIDPSEMRVGYRLSFAAGRRFESTIPLADLDQPELPMAPIKMRFIAPYVPRPGGMGPLFWRDEETGELPKAVGEYFEAAMEDREMSQEHLELVKAYCVYCIEAPCWRWNGIPGLPGTIIQAVSQAETREQLSAALHFLPDGIDPL